MKLQPVFFSIVVLLFGMTLHAFALDLNVINAAAVDEPVMTDVITFCNEQLPFTLTVQTVESFSCTNMDTCQDALAALKTEKDAAAIGLVSLAESDLHQSINTNRMTALINVKPLLSDDTQKTTWRLQRMIMRSVAFLLGMEPSGVPHCVTGPVESVEELDAISRNYFPLYTEKLAKRASEYGLKIRTNQEAAWAPCQE
ncbi:MAG: hypothetical protein PHP44_14125 [Kiritimatiellae bacterium]|nr:hypothetical protein [Kiritimatiellia bacterium]